MMTPKFIDQLKMHEAKSKTQQHLSDLRLKSLGISELPDEEVEAIANGERLHDCLSLIFTLEVALVDAGEMGYDPRGFMVVSERVLNWGRKAIARQRGESKPSKQVLLCDWTQVRSQLTARAIAAMIIQLRRKKHEFTHVGPVRWSCEESFPKWFR